MPLCSEEQVDRYRSHVIMYISPVSQISWMNYPRLRVSILTNSRVGYFCTVIPSFKQYWDERFSFWSFCYDSCVLVLFSGSVFVILIYDGDIWGVWSVSFSSLCPWKTDRVCLSCSCVFQLLPSNYVTTDSKKKGEIVLKLRYSNPVNDIYAWFLNSDNDVDQPVSLTV